MGIGAIACFSRIAGTVAVAGVNRQGERFESWREIPVSSFLF
jgi:hypothetical protein